MSENTSPPASPPEPATPRYRHFTVAPRTIDLPAEVLLSAVPADARTRRDPGGPLTIPCADVLASNSPRVRSSRLREWLPDSIAPDADLPEWLPLPTAKVALAYRPTTGREALPTPAEPFTGSQSVPVEKPVTPPPTPSKPGWKRILKPVLGPSVEELEERRQALLRPQQETAQPSPPEEKPVLNLPPKPIPAPTPPTPTPTPARTDVLPTSAALRAIFHTDEDLTLQNVTDLAGSLAGVQGCVLTVGEDLRLSADIPEGFDVRAIRDQLLNLLTDAPKNVTSRGAIRTPALTLYFEQGPISIMRHGNASFLIVHQERTFLPGLREKLSTALESLNTEK